MKIEKQCPTIMKIIKPLKIEPNNLLKYIELKKPFMKSKKRLKR